MEDTMQGMELDNMAVMITVVDKPLKASDADRSVEHDAVEEQAHHARESLRPATSERPGTCIDERQRAGVLSGESTVEPRLSVPGGPDIYGLYIAELTGFFGDSQMSGEDRLRTVKQSLNAANITSGGHKGCAANASFGAVLGLMAGDQREAAQTYTQSELGDDYDQVAMDEVLANAEAVVASGRYDDWDESVLERVLGDEAGYAIEVLQPVPHEGKTFARNKVKGQTIHQNALHDAAGADSFVQDDPYADEIENALADGPQAAWKQKVARHAREALIAAIAPALPNPELDQFNLTV